MPDGQITSHEKLDGPERAAIVLLALGEQNGKSLWERMDDDDITAVSSAIARIGTVPAPVVERILFEFVSDLARASTVLGSYESAQRILKGVLSEDKVNEVMAEIRHPRGRNMWEKLATVSDEDLATFLKSEHPQTAALILSKLKPAHAAKVLGQLPQDFALDSIGRMLSLEPVRREVLDRVESALRDQFLANVSHAHRTDPHESMAEIFNCLDRQTEQRLMGALESRDTGSAERIKSLMFLFEDLVILDKQAMQTLMREIDKSRIALALKGATDQIRELFFDNMSERAAKLMRDDMEIMGAVRLRDVEEAQSDIVATAKALAERGEITIMTDSDEEMVG